ncbi:ATP-binding protein [Paenibacillus sp. 1781tsa1]|uniref:ATP-binding protein n=1 Tax=Paenibacillus sp. 1781tsa1 TaxID=2953810 RepID=UPI0020A0C71B|nr:ATP-binding protein [Paenibacillus sp. 1781tsa1]MCP1182939.1 ATP-binding protein [Paenibacillus sp. 1781tsa1]
MSITISLPSRYEDLDTAYRGRLVPNSNLLSIINTANKSIQISGGIRFLPMYGESGAGKTSAVREISTHIPSTYTFQLNREEIESKEKLFERVQIEKIYNIDKLLIAIIDQYEEGVVGRETIPTQFVEYLSLLDRGEFRNIPIVFIWLTTNREFQRLLVDATSRNKRILLSDDFIISGPVKEEWPSIIEETFSFHNSENSLADYGILEPDLVDIGLRCNTIGAAIEKVGSLLASNIDDVDNLSDYQVILMWPVADSVRIQRVLQFSKPREGYKLNWDAWYRELNDEDRASLPLREFNKTRLYFDLRIVPVKVADLHKLCLSLEDENYRVPVSPLNRFKATHFYLILSDNWTNYNFNPVRDRESQRSIAAREWYQDIPEKSVALGKRISEILRLCDLEASYEKNINTEYSSVRADVYVKKEGAQKNKLIIEMKVFSSENTKPSSIKDAIKVTLRRHAQLAGFLQRQ